MPELLQQRPATVDLVKQKYRCVVKKGAFYKEVERTIKNVAVPFWQAFLEGCQPNQYLFGVDFAPADKPMSDDTPGRWWKRIVKNTPKEGGLGINVDMYSLKHLNTDEITATLGATDAAALNAHENEDMVLQVYAVGEAQRQHERLKKVGNGFA